MTSIFDVNRTSILDVLLTSIKRRPKQTPYGRQSKTSDGRDIDVPIIMTVVRLFGDLWTSILDVQNGRRMDVHRT